MAKYSSFKNQQLLTENFRSFLTEDEEQLDELMGVGLGTLPLAYKWLAPLHQIINRLDSSESARRPEGYKRFVNWYKNSDEMQTLGDAVVEWEKVMKKLWDSGMAGKSAVASIHGAAGLVDVSGTGAAMAFGKAFSRIRDGMLKK